MSADSVDQVSSRTASRNRSVAAKTTFSPEISTRMPVSIGSVSSRPAATATWPMASANRSDGDDTRLLRQRGQRRVVLDGHRRQREPGTAAGQRHPGALDADVDRLGRQRPGDVGQQPTGHQNASRRSDFGRNLHFGRHLVVESGDRQTVVGTGEQHTGQHRHRRPGRQVACHPGHRVGEVFAHQPELQVGRPTVVVATSMRPFDQSQQALTSGFRVFLDVSPMRCDDRNGCRRTTVELSAPS